MRCPRILAKVICCGLVRVRKMDELAKDRFRRLEQTLSLSAGTARFIHVPVVCNTCRDRLSCWATARSFCAVICSLTLGTLLRSRVVLSVSARPRPMSREFDLPKEGAFRGLAFAIARVR